MINRGRRLRATAAIRDLVRENTLSSNDFIFPIFVVEGDNKKEEISSMKGNYHWSIDRLPEIVQEVEKSNIRGIILFGVPNHKDDCGTESYNDNGIVQQAIRKIREISKDLYIIADVCMCQYTSHGHCGILNGHEVDNDKTLEVLGKIALSYAKAGANMVAPSDMMDGRIGYIREALDKNNYENIAIMSYAAKYSSAFYGPFREAAHSEEAIKEIEWDIKEGADIIMVKPAMSYLDIIRRAKEKVNVPICAYNVSGEFAMVKSAAEAGLINEKSVALEMLLSMKRAGADIIITYFALDAVRWLKEN